MSDYPERAERRPRHPGAAALLDAVGDRLTLEQRHALATVLDACHNAHERLERDREVVPGDMRGLVASDADIRAVAAHWHRLTVITLAQTTREETTDE